MTTVVCSRSSHGLIKMYFLTYLIAIVAVVCSKEDAVETIVHSRHKRSTPNAMEAKLVLDKHNELRATIGDEGEEPKPSNMRLLTWDEGLAITSLTYAKKCIWKHSAKGDRKTPSLNFDNGENLWTGVGGDLSTNFDPIYGIMKWFNEYKDYDFVNQTCVPGKKCGHYTQMVWATTYKLGCAWTVCPKLLAGDEELQDATYLICHYAPGGNIEGDPLYKVGPRCSECNSFDTCPDGTLCHNEKRDVIIAVESNSATLAGALVGIVLILATLGAVGYYVYLNYGRKTSLFAAMRKSRRVSSSVDINECEDKDYKSKDGDTDIQPPTKEKDLMDEVKIRGSRLSSIKIETGAIPD